MSRQEKPMDAETIEAQAIAWHFSLADANAATWDDFTTWLEADRRHALAYDRVIAAECDIDHALPTPLGAANDHDTGRPFRWRWSGAGFGIAAAAAMAVLYSGFGSSYPEPFEVATGLGQQRTVKLADGTKIALNGSSMVTLDRRNPRLAVLKSGEAVFTVVHDDKAPFIVNVGGGRIVDVGTIFNVVTVGKSVTVTVKQGRVRYTSGVADVPLQRGQSLTDAGGSDPIVIGNRHVDAIASWQTGRLDYDLQPLGLVSQDVARYLGVPVTIDASLAGRQFSGTIQIDRDRPRFFARLAKLLGVKARPDGNGWKLTAQ
ncbi:FecR domain-containing protein [Sphingomonas sp.]|uniref:FecR family protein n=1 Tax=Sphingomonas sp. TaxID=28214 RepID=UPI0025DD89CF|nr:FecR domain-containing protein [Sphingomonas sp.]